MLDRQGIIQKEAETEDPTVYKIIHILTPGYKGVKGYTLEKLSVQDHGSAKGKRRALEPRSAADDLIKGARLAAEAVPIGHPRLWAYIVVILPLTIQAVAGNAVHDVSVDSSAQEFQRARHKVRQFENFIIVDEQSSVRRQDGGGQQANVAHI